MDRISESKAPQTNPRARVPRYQVIATTLAELIADGTYASGALLPSEAELSATYEVSRVTIRKALEQLRTMGCAASHQGLGWVVARRPVRHRLAQLTTIESQLRANGLTSERRVISFGFVKAPPDVEAALGGSDVLEITRVVFGDAVPVAVMTVWCRGDLGSKFSRSDVEEHSVLSLLGVAIGGAEQRIHAANATEEVAQLLSIPTNSAVLIVERVTHDRGGRVVLVSRHTFAGHLSEFYVELPTAAAIDGPEGMQLKRDRGAT